MNAMIDSGRSEFLDFEPLQRHFSGGEILSRVPGPIYLIVNLMNQQRFDLKARKCVAVWQVTSIFLQNLRKFGNFRFSAVAERNFAL